MKNKERKEEKKKRKEIRTGEKERKFIDRSRIRKRKKERRDESKRWW